MELQKHIFDQLQPRMESWWHSVVYATCSIFPYENRGQVDAFFSRES